MEKTLQQLERSTSKKTITEGGFESLEIGQRKNAVISVLLNMGVNIVSPNVKNVITVRSASNLDEVEEAESIALDGTHVLIRIKFSGNNIESVKVPPHSEWENRFKSIATRDEVFKLFANILVSDPKAYVRNISADSHQIKLNEITEGDRRLLKKYDAWEMNRDNKMGYWHFRLEFSNDILEKIIVQHSPEELP